MASPAPGWCAQWPGHPLRAPAGNVNSKDQPLLRPAAAAGLGQSLVFLSPGLFCSSSWPGNWSWCRVLADRDPGRGPAPVTPPPSSSSTPATPRCLMISGWPWPSAGEASTLNLAELRQPLLTAAAFGLLCYPLGFSGGVSASSCRSFRCTPWLREAHVKPVRPVVDVCWPAVLLKWAANALPCASNVQMLPEVHLALRPALIRARHRPHHFMGALKRLCPGQRQATDRLQFGDHRPSCCSASARINSLRHERARFADDQPRADRRLRCSFRHRVFYEATKTLSIPNMGGLAKVLPINLCLLSWQLVASLALPGMSGFVSEITVFLGVTSNEGFHHRASAIVTVLLAAIGLVPPGVLLLSDVPARVFFGRDPGVAVLGDMRRANWCRPGVARAQPWPSLLPRWRSTSMAPAPRPGPDRGPPKRDRPPAASRPGLSPRRRGDRLKWARPF